MVSMHRRWSIGRTKLISCVACLVLSIFVAVVFIPIRNLVFYPVIELAWRDIPTLDLLRIHYSREVIPEGVNNPVSCPKLRVPLVTRSDINVSGVLTYPQLLEKATIDEVVRRRHARFLPALNINQKVDLLLLYAVLVEALRQEQVEHFIVAGSLLGLMRHGGMVPWDDDLDVSVSFQHWELVKQTLACLQGYSLTIFQSFHWKFSFEGHSFPFLDVFFYQRDERYVWSLTHYIRKTYIYPARFVFPLTKGVFEGIEVPIPRDSLSVSRRIYDYDQCSVFPGHTDSKNKTLLAEHAEAFAIISLDCCKLSYMYRMSHLDDSS